jgi:hypothetical protein
LVVDKIILKNKNLLLFLLRKKMTLGTLTIENVSSNTPIFYAANQVINLTFTVTYTLPTTGFPINTNYPSIIASVTNNSTPISNFSSIPLSSFSPSHTFTLQYTTVNPLGDLLFNFNVGGTVEPSSFGQSNGGTVVSQQKNITLVYTPFVMSASIDNFTDNVPLNDTGTTTTSFTCNVNFSFTLANRSFDPSLIGNVSLLEVINYADNTQSSFAISEFKNSSSIVLQKTLFKYQTVITHVQPPNDFSSVSFTIIPFFDYSNISLTGTSVTRGITYYQVANPDISISDSTIDPFYSTEGNFIVNLSAKNTGNVDLMLDKGSLTMNNLPAFGNNIPNGTRLRPGETLAIDYNLLISQIDINHGRLSVTMKIYPYEYVLHDGSVFSTISTLSTTDVNLTTRITGNLTTTVTGSQIFPGLGKKYNFELIVQNGTNVTLDLVTPVSVNTQFNLLNQSSVLLPNFSLIFNCFYTVTANDISNGFINQDIVISSSRYSCAL